MQQRDRSKQTTAQIQPHAHPVGGRQGRRAKPHGQSRNSEVSKGFFHRFLLRHSLCHFKVEHSLALVHRCDYIINYYFTQTDGKKSANFMKAVCTVT